MGTYSCVLTFICGICASFGFDSSTAPHLKWVFKSGKFLESKIELNSKRTFPLEKSFFRLENPFEIISSSKVNKQRKKSSLICT